MQKKPETEISTKALRVTDATHKAFIAYKKKKKLTVDEAIRAFLRSVKVVVPLILLATIIKAEDKPPVIPVEVQLKAAKLQMEEAMLKQMQAEWQRRMAVLQAATQELIHSLTVACAGPKWHYVQVPDEVGTKFVCEAAPAPDKAH